MRCVVYSIVRMRWWRRDTGRWEWCWVETMSRTWSACWWKHSPPVDHHHHPVVVGVYWSTVSSVEPASGTAASASDSPLLLLTTRHYISSSSSLQEWKQAYTAYISTQSLNVICTPWVKKRRHYTVADIFAKYWPIFIRYLIQVISSFSGFNISQGSVATHLRWDEIFVNNFIANFLLMCRWKNYENRSIFSKDMDKSIVSPFFDSRCISQ